jgi:hypothetical protein
MNKFKISFLKVGLKKLYNTKRTGGVAGEPRFPARKF